MATFKKFNKDKRPKRNTQSLLFKRKRFCRFTVAGVEEIDYKDVDLLKDFITDNGKIVGTLPTVGEVVVVDGYQLVVERLDLVQLGDRHVGDQAGGVAGVVHAGQRELGGEGGDVLGGLGAVGRDVAGDDGQGDGPPGQVAP